MIDRKRTACFTGHRNIPTPHRQQLTELLDRMIEVLYRKGVVFYGAGGAYGFDMEAEKAVLRARDRHPDIRLILVLPCRDQDKYWTAENKAVFAEMLQMANKIVYTEETYCRGCMHKRNRHLVDYSGYCIAYLTENSGGTAYTVEYARQNGLKVVNLAAYLR